MRLKCIIIGMINKIYNRIISTRLINKNNKVCRRIRAAFLHNICFSCTAEFGPLNPDKTFYVIRCSHDETGLFGLYNNVVAQMKKADELHAIPIVDWQFYPNGYISEDDEVGRVNVWELYFEQPIDYSLKDIYKSKNVVMSSGEIVSTLGDIRNSQELSKDHEEIEKHIRLNDSTKDKLKRESLRVGIGKYSVLGLKLRGTDFTATKPQYHAIMPTNLDAIKIVEKCEHDWQVGDRHFDRIYLATEDRGILMSMKEHFGDKLIYTEGEHFSNTGNKWMNEVIDEKRSEKHYKYKRMLEYLISVYVLSECDALIAPPIGGTLGAMSIKGKYKDLYIMMWVSKVSDDTIVGH